MSPLRTLGYLGIVILVLGDLFAIAYAFSIRDWYGVFVTLAFLPIIAVFIHGLRASARRERQPQLAATDGLGWFGESFSSFIRSPVLHTPEGIVLVVGSFLSWGFALLALFAPLVVVLNPSRSSVNATLFGIWPVLAFVLYVKLSAPHFQPRLFNLLAMLAICAVPFYQAYK